MTHTDRPADHQESGILAWWVEKHRDTPTVRVARVARRQRDYEERPLLKEVAAYMPGNYAAVEVRGDILIVGIDEAGWTLDDYVIPRLASGLITAEELHGVVDDLVGEIATLRAERDEYRRLHRTTAAEREDQAARALAAEAALRARETP